MRKTFRSITLSFTLVILSITYALGAMEIAIGMVGTMADLAIQYYYGTQQERASALTQLNKFWQVTGGGRDHAIEIGYDKLCDMCAELNQNGFPCEIRNYPGSLDTNVFCIYGTGDVIVPGIIPTTVNAYSINNRMLHGPNGSLYPFIGTKDLSVVDKLESIRLLLVDVRSYLTTISSRLLTFSNNFDTYASTVTTWLSARASDISNIADRLIATYSINGTSYTASNATWTAWIYGAVDGLESSLSTTYINNTGTITEWTAWNYEKLRDIANRLVITRADGNDYSAATLLSRIWDSVDNNLYVVSYNASRDKVYVSRFEAEMMCANINSLASKNVNVLSTYWTTNYSSIKATAYIDDSTNVIMIRFKNPSSNGTLLQALCNGFLQMYVVKDGSVDLDGLYTMLDSKLTGMVSGARVGVGSMVANLVGYSNTLVSNTNSLPSFISSSMTNNVNLMNKLNSIESALYGEQTVEDTRSTALVPIGETALTLTDTFIEALSPVGTFFGILDICQDIYDVIDDLSGGTDYTTVLNNINNALRVTVDHETYTIAQLQYATAQRTNDIYEWLTSADLLDDDDVSTVIDDWGDYVVNGIQNGNNVLSLFYHAYLGVIGEWDSNAFSDAVDYFDTLYTGGSVT